MNTNNIPEKRAMQLIFDMAKSDTADIKEIEKLEERYHTDSTTLLAFYSENKAFIIAAQEELIRGDADGHNLEAVFWGANRACRMLIYQKMLAPLSSSRNYYNTDGTLRTSVFGMTLDVLRTIREELSEAKVPGQGGDDRLHVSVSGIDPTNLQ